MMAAPCPLCHTPCVFPGPAPLLAALDSLARGPILCPLPLCGHTAASLDSLILHLASCHSDNIAVSHQHPLLSDNNPVFQQKQQQQLESDNIEQVIKDLEDLVESEIELKPQLSAGPCVITGLAPDIVTQPLPTWSCPTPDSGRGSQMQSPQGSNISLPGPGYQSLLSELPGQSCQLNSINHQGMSNQVSTPSLSSLMIAPPPPPPAPAHAAWLPQGQYPGPEAGPLYSDHTQPQLRVTGPARGQLGASHPHKSLPYTKPGASGAGGHRGSGSSGPVECGQCGWMFDNVSFLHLHRVLMHSRRQRMEAGARGRVTEVMTSWRCDQCPGGEHTPEVFTDMTQFTGHLQSVHGDHRHVCKYCAKMFKLKGSLLVHQRVMHQPLTPGSRDRGPDVTETNVTSSGDLSLEDTGGRGARDTETTDNTQIGPGDDTKLEEMTQITCKIDNKVALSDTAQSAKQSQDTVKQWDCSFCGKKFTTKYFLKKHIRLHTGETPYSCNICGKTFSFQQSYHKHMLYHTDKKPHCCKVCGRSFKELSTLQNHERIHSGERPFVCETCGKSFRQRVSYLVHRRIHTGALPYSCDACGRKFRYKVTQRTHKCSPSAALGAPSPGSGEMEERSHLEGAQNQQSEASISITMPPLSQEIKKDLLKLKQAQGRRQFSSRIQNILSKTHKRRNQAPSAGPSAGPAVPPQHLSALSRLTLEDLEPMLEAGGAGEEGGVTLHSGTGDLTQRVSGEQLEEINNVFIDFNGNF